MDAIRQLVLEGTECWEEEEYQGAEDEGVGGRAEISHAETEVVAYSW